MQAGVVDAAEWQDAGGRVQFVAGENARHYASMSPAEFQAAIQQQEDFARLQQDLAELQENLPSLRGAENW